MKSALLLFLGFFVSLAIASALVTSLPAPLVYFPLMHVTGLLVLNRVGVAEGAVWIIAGGMALAWTGIQPGIVLQSMVIAAAGALLTEKLFATRSVYALLGLGITTGLGGALARLLYEGVGNMWRGTTLVREAAVSQAFWTLLWLLVGLYVGFVLLVSVRQRLKQFIVLR